MSITLRSAEALTRRVNRRQFLARTAATVFGAAAAVAVGLPGLPDVALANSCQVTETATACNPPGGVYCTQYNSGYCSGGDCAGGCSYDYTYHKSTACWCTTTNCYDCRTSNAYCGYWKCCDCSCPGHGGCGCGQFTYTCSCPYGAECLPCC